ncbi:MULTISPECIES: hypothetical protein [unclassified Kribbella]|uniref:hypothetical protein n=1 Tax=unclassified Kribbella TaxID=2644121 RepID=UPI0033DC233E
MTHPWLADGPIYLEYNATMPVDSRVVDAALPPYLTHHFGDSSSSMLVRSSLAPRSPWPAGRWPACPAPTPPGSSSSRGGSEADTLAIRGAVHLLRTRGSSVLFGVGEGAAVVAQAIGRRFR